MGQFLGELKLTPLDDGMNWQEDGADFGYKTDDGDVIMLPQGRITDLASTPRFIWNIYPPFGRYLKAAVIHDELYTDQRFTKEKSDRIFDQAMRDSGVYWLTRWNLYHAVKWFGFAAWAKHTRDNLAARAALPTTTVKEETP